MHIHVPAGAVPKDGPSAGVAMFVALVSAHRPARPQRHGDDRRDLACAGWCCPIGGIKEKVLAAVQAGITKVLLPARNRKDLEDVPERARKLVRFVWVERIDELLAAALSESKAASDDPSTSGDLPAPSVKRAARSR